MAARFPGYSYADDYISDLGASAVMNVAFMVHGSLFFVGALVISRAIPSMGWAGWGFVLAAAANAAGNVLVGAFRSGVPAHVIGAGLAIVGGNVAVIIAGFGSARVGASPTYRRASITIGIVGLGCLLADHRRRQWFSTVAGRHRGAWFGVLDHRLGDHDRCGCSPPPVIQDSRVSGEKSFV